MSDTALDRFVSPPTTSTSPVPASSLADSLSDSLASSELSDDLTSTAPAPPQYSHLDVSTALLSMNGEGGFEGESLEEYNAVKAALKADNLPHKDRDIRFAMLKSRVESASEAHEAAQAGMTGTDRAMGLFMGPEWALGKNNTQEDMQFYEDSFTALSADHPEMMIMPGTGVWQERASKPGTKASKETKMHAHASAYFGGEVAHTQKKATMNGDHRGVKDHLKHSIRKPGVTEDRAQKWWGKGNTSEAPDSSLFSAGGRSFALDICGDHNSGRALDESMTAGDTTGVDAHLLTSKGMFLNDRTAVMRDGGIGVSCDGSGISYVDTATSTSTHRRAATDHPTLEATTTPSEDAYSRRRLEHQSRGDLGEAHGGTRDEHRGTFRFA